MGVREMKGLKGKRFTKFIMKQKKITLKCGVFKEKSHRRNQNG